ncbi:MAG: hypothetical protein EOP83_16660 [Verrucomicrobiaceae bacterium]|nr:MAG: hypothetical protein EOP83_16660 [Verrucomicrobiaceae bacterium]
MSSHNASPRTPEPRHRTRSVAGATQGTQTSHSSSSGTRRRRGERQEGLLQAKKEWVVTGLIGALLIMAVAGLWLMGRKHSGGKASLSPVDRAEASSPLEKWQGPIPSVIAERFIEAKTQEERLELVRNPAQVGPAMEAFFKKGPGVTEQVKGFFPLARGSSGDLSFEKYNVEFASSPSRLLSVTIDPRGAKVDFECYARLGSVTWDDVLSGKATEAAEVRVLLQAGSYYLHAFKEEQKWLHFKATSSDFPETLDFYLDRENPAVRDFEESGNRVFPATLSIRAVNGSEKHHQFEITAVKALEWVEPD